MNPATISQLRLCWQISVWRRGVIICGMILCSLALPGMAAPWVQTTSLPDTYVGHSLVYASGYLYQAGGASGINGILDGTNVFYAQVHSNGTIGNWNSATPLPEPAIYHAGVTANGFVYVIGGETYNLAEDSFAITNIIYYAKINSDASLGSWHIANPLPNILEFLSASVWNNRIYVIGGFDENMLFNNVYSATIQNDGSLSAWVTQASLPVTNYTQAEVANGFLYVLGGATGDGSVILNTVYYTKINSDGTLAGWTQTSLLPQPECNFGAVVVNGWIFTVGGSNGNVPTSSFYGAAVKGDGSLASWSSGTSLPLTLTLQGVAASDSYIFVSGGGSAEASSSAVYSMALPLPPAAPQFVSRSFTNGNFQLQLASSTNTGFGLLASTNLTSWTNIGWSFTGTNGLLLFQDTNATSFPNRFYRAYWPLP
jgi:hypothetical protein